MKIKALIILAAIVLIALFSSAYVVDETGDFRSVCCNRDSVDLEPLDTGDVSIVQGLIRRHQTLTGSPRAQWILEHWDALLPKLIKVFPREYKRVLEKSENTDQEARQAVHG